VAEVDAGTNAPGRGDGPPAAVPAAAVPAATTPAPAVGGSPRPGPVRRFGPPSAVLAGLALLVAGLVAAVTVALSGLDGLRGLVEHGNPSAGGGTPAPNRSLPTRSADPQHVATTLHVSPRGSDAASGTADEPLGTLGNALQRLQPGDTLVVDDGEYTESLRDVVISPGTAAQRIRVEPAPGARPVLVGLLWLRGADYWDITGLDVRWDPRDGAGDHMVKFMGGTGWTLSDAELSGARSYAALLISSGAARFRVSGMYIHDTLPANDNSQDHLIYVNTDAQGGVVERNLLVGSRNGRAIKVGPPKDGPDLLGNLEIRYNTMVDNRGPSNVSLSYNTAGVKVYRNIMVDPGNDQANVTAKQLSGTGNRVWDNVIFGSIGATEPGVKRLVDGGGNIVLDPQFADPSSGDYRPRNPKATGYGRFAP
jgi:hypothetical protein